MNNFIFGSMRFSNFHIKRPTSSEAISGTTIIFFFGCEKIKRKLVKTQNLELHICDLTRKIFFEFTLEYLLTRRIEDLVLVLSFHSGNNFEKLNFLFNQQMIHLKVEKKSINFQISIIFLFSNIAPTQIDVAGYISIILLNYW